MMSFESSSTLYNVLHKELGAKARKSLENLKVACDLIVAARGVMNYSAVARVSTEQFGGPKVQTVQNNKDLKRYVAARMLEYHQAKKTHNPPAAKKAGATQRKYPIDDLDPRTKTYIDQLHTRLELTETRYQELRKWQEEFTRANPVNLGEAIGLGPSSNGAIQLEYKRDDTELLHNVREGIRTLLSLPDHISSIKVETRDEMKRLTHKRPSGDRILIDPTVFTALERFLEEAANA